MLTGFRRWRWRALSSTASGVISFLQAHDAVLRLANTLLACGIRKGEGVAIFTAVNRPEALLLQLAVHLIGCRLIFVPPEPGRDELIAYVRQANPQAFVFDPGVGSLALALAGQFSLPVMLSFGPAGIGTDLLELMTSAPRSGPTPQGRRMTLPRCSHTGGTTGQPKLVTHRHRYYDNLVFVASRRRMDSDGIRPDTDLHSHDASQRACQRDHVPAGGRDDACRSGELRRRRGACGSWAGGRHRLGADPADALRMLDDPGLPQRGSPLSPASITAAPPPPPPDCARPSSGSAR